MVRVNLTYLLSSDNDSVNLGLQTTHRQRIPLMRTRLIWRFQGTVDVGSR